MAKGKTEVRHQRDLALDPGGALAARERVLETVDHNDFPIPDAAEMAGYHRVNPAIVTWMLDHAKLEQQHRHQANDRFLREFERDGTNARRLRGWGMLSGFIVFMAGLVISGFLIYKDHGIAGSIMGGSTLVAAAALFVNQRSRETDGQGKPITPTQPVATITVAPGGATLDTPEQG